MCTRIDTLESSYIASVGIYRIDANYYWCIRHTSGGVPPQNYTLATINNQTWYSVEFYVNVTANGNFTMWIDDVFVCQTLGDYSALGELGLVLAYANVYGAQSDGKTVLHDDFRIDDDYMGSGNPQPFQTSVHFLTGVEDEPEVFDPLQYVTINGTGTSASGYYEWTNLVYDTTYTFVIGNITGYYPAWCLNVEGSYIYNGTNYILQHTLFENQTGYIKIHFFSTSKPFVRQTSSLTRLTDASITADTIYGDEHSFAVNGSSWFIIDDASYDEEPFLSGGNVTSVSYNSTTGYYNITTASATTVKMLFNRPTPIFWGGWWLVGSGVGLGWLIVLIRRFEEFYVRHKRVIQIIVILWIIGMIVLTIYLLNAPAPTAEDLNPISGGHY